MMIFLCYVYAKNPSFRFGGTFKEAMRHQKLAKEKDDEESGDAQ